MLNFMTTVNTHEAKTHLSRLLRRAAAGEEIVIARAGTPVARLVPLDASARSREMGFAREGVSIAEDFDAPLPPEIVHAFYGEGPESAEDPGGAR